jgi:hypothetical protein
MSACMQPRDERKALEKVLPSGIPFRRFRPNDKLLSFLESL